MKTPTAKDVSDVANVSMSTVSRYLNRTAPVAKKKIIAIEQAISDLGFIPLNAKPQGIRTKEKLIGLMIPTFDSSFISSTLDGMDPEIQNSVYRLVIETSHWDKTSEINVIQRMVKQGIEGLIVLVNSLSEAEIKAIVGELPVLVVAGVSEGIYSHISIDNIAGGRLATEHLIGLGHRNIVHLYSSELGNKDSLQRSQGYRESLERAGINYNEKLSLDGGYRATCASRAMQSLIEQGIEFTAVFAANDLSALGAIKTLLQNGIKVPDQVSVVGFDDSPAASVFLPKLTTIKQPLQKMGSIAIQQMVVMIAGKTVSLPSLELELIVRGSTDKVVFIGEQSSPC
ncbi:LacI family transcriptional regulator [Vibrio inusitatus NBRC 102082]|uniref:LacI family transcriptional regulator n=1 Tax=Vibrio inusitatus NBRC 102082 TaxID=1219070 RepID=A0A4Y3HSZ1_9VIBR|nr:LacI family DNA-binding transcriptional regulator [Vibrio inusitatus]GEA49862.1 LacI family transcriptional regulator [Vibrio inusitatus NBRC 102082]